MADNIHHGALLIDFSSMSRLTNQSPIHARNVLSALRPPTARSKLGEVLVVHVIGETCEAMLVNQIWTIALSFAGGMISLATLYIGWKQLRRKSLAYEVIFYDNVLNPGDLFDGQVEIIFHGRTVPNLSLALVRIWNAGNEPIKKEDFETSLVLSFADAAILSYEVLRTIPANVKPSLNIASGNLSLSPMLLNGGDSVYIKTILTGPKSAVALDSHIVGVNRIVRNSYPGKPLYYGQVAVLTQVSAVLFMLFAFLPVFVPPLNRTPYIIIDLSLTIFFMLTFAVTALMTNRSTLGKLLSKKRKNEFAEQKQQDSK